MNRHPQQNLEPHMDRQSLLELVDVFFSLSEYIEREEDWRKQIELYDIATQMGAVLHQFAKPLKNDMHP